ncbi:MAG: hypothetical protein ACUVWX_12685 [Kiritimatiellia bacterium]
MKKSGLLLLPTLLFALNASALLITPMDLSLVMTGSEPSQATITSILEDYFASILPYDLPLLYKQEVDGAEDGLFAPYYTTFFSPPGDAENGLITWVGPQAINQESVYMLVKDGNQSPSWYLFNLRSAGWDGQEDLELRGFWPAKGSISHVTIYGGGTSIPDGGTTLTLLGLALLGLGTARKLLKA